MPGGTDHLAFDQIGLPGFQFIQDQKQAATIMAASVYQSAMMEGKMPRKPASAPVK